jgi:hypothetical protein
VFWRKPWIGEPIMAFGVKNSTSRLSIMQELRQTIRDCPTPFEVTKGSHFLQKWAKGC